MEELNNCSSMNRLQSSEQDKNIKHINVSDADALSAKQRLNHLKYSQVMVDCESISHISGHSFARELEQNNNQIPTTVSTTMGLMFILIV